MKREHSDKEDNEATPTRLEKRRESSSQHSVAVDGEQEQPETDKRSKVDTSLDLTDLGAGYQAEDRKLVRAISLYETKLLPYIEAHPGTFRKSNFLSLKGYASGIPSTSGSGDNISKDQ